MAENRRIVGNHQHPEKRKGRLMPKNKPKPAVTPERIKPGSACDYFTPTGKQIVACREMLFGTANLRAILAPVPGKEAEIEYADQTDVDWDSQRPVRRRRKVAGQFQKVRLFVDESGDLWLEDVLILKPQPIHRE
jgi:hypothetical protein